MDARKDWWIREGDLSRIMTRPPISVEADVNLAEAAEKMLRQGVGALLVTDARGLLIGILTEGDFTARRVGIPFSTFHAPQVLGQWLGEEAVERIYARARGSTVGEAMTSPVQAVTEDQDVKDVLQLMLDRDLKHVPVVRDDRAIGMIARHDLLKMMLVGQGEDEAAAGANPEEAR